VYRIIKHVETQLRAVYQR